MGFYVRYIEKIIIIFNSIIIEIVRFLKYCFLEDFLIKIEGINLNFYLIK